MAFAKSLSQEQFEQKHALEVEVAKRELERRAKDIIRVYNPLDVTFRFMYDRFWHSVLPHRTKDFERYIAIHFFKKICDKMIGDQISLKGEELKALREKQLGKQFLDKYEENVQIWDRQPKMNDPELIAQIKNVVIIGLVEEYGMEEPEPEARVVDPVTDFRPLHEQILGTIGAIPASQREVTTQETIVPQQDIEAILSGKHPEEQHPMEPNFGERMKAAREAKKAKLAENVI